MLKFRSYSATATVDLTIPTAQNFTQKPWSSCRKRRACELLDTSTLAKQFQTTWRWSISPWRCKCQHRRSATAFRSLWVCSLCVTVLLRNQVRWSHEWSFMGIWKTPLHLRWPTQTWQSHEYIWPRSKCSKTSTNSHPHTRTYTSVDSVGRSTETYQDQIWQNQMQQWGYQLVDEQTHGATWMNEISKWSALRQTVGTLVAEFL